MKRALALGFLAGVMLAGPGLAATKPTPKAGAPKTPAVPVQPPGPVLPTPLPGEPLFFTVFRTVCIDHQGDVAAAEAEARKQGFETVPPAPDEDPAAIASRVILKRETDGQPLAVILNKAPPEVVAKFPNAEATFCGVGGPQVYDTAVAAAKAWVGLASNSQDGNHTSYLYRQTSNQRLILADQDEAAVKAAIAASEFRVLDIDPEPEGLTIGLLSWITRPSPP
jgi:hypothetical protein